MRNPALILCVDDTPENLEILQVRLEANGYEVAQAVDGEDGLAKARELKPDLILLDVMMPKLDGIAVVKALKADPVMRGIPVILVTAKSDTSDVVAGLDAGGDDYLSKPFEHAALLARVRSMLRQKALHDKVEEQAAQMEDWNRSLRRFLPNQLADLVMSANSSDASASLLQSHRREVTVVFCDLRGFTAFAETAEPEEVMTVLKEYHACLGAHIIQHEGTLERFMGDGLLVVFNDPVIYDDHTERAVRMSLGMRDDVAAFTERWRKQGHDLGFGIGIARGHATIGRIGFDQRWDYAVIGTVPNLAARLCAEAETGQILVGQRVFSAIEQSVESRHIGDLALKGLSRPVPTYDIIRWVGGHFAAPAK